MEVTDKRQWLSEMDVLKGIAILIIIYVHLDSFLYNYSFIYNTQTYVVVIGLGLFFFVSGYTLFHNNNKIKDQNDMIVFYKKRLFRIFPLYWLSIISIIVVFGLLLVTPGATFQYNLSISNLAINFLGLQSVIPGYDIPPLWFIGDILLCYLLYPVVIRFSKDIKDMIIISLGICLLCILLNIFFNIIRSEFIWNFAIFIVGAILYKAGFFSTIKNLYACIFPLLIVLLLLPCYFILKMTYVLSMLTFAGQLLFIPIFYWFIKKYIVIHNLLVKIFSKISYGAYAIYLFHIQLFSIFKEIMNGLSIVGISFDILFLIVIIPLTILLSYLFQVYFNKLQNILTTTIRRG